MGFINKIMENDQLEELEYAKGAAVRESMEESEAQVNKDFKKEDPKGYVT